MSTPTVPPPEITIEDLKKRYAALIELQKKIGGEAHARVAAHIRAVTGGGHVSLGTYHVAKSIPIDQRYEEYAVIAGALLGASTDPDTGKQRIGSPDWSRLKGQIGAGSKNAVVDVETVPPVTTDLDHSLEVASRAVPAIRQPDPEPDDEPPTDDLATTIANAVMKRFKMPTPIAQLDEGRVRLLIGEELAGLDIEGRVAKANQNGAFPVDRVKAMMDERIAGNTPTINIVSPAGETRSMARQHYKFPLLLAALGQRLNVALVGPAGSSKTTTARNAALALGVDFHAISVGPMTSKADLLGFIDAGGKYHETSTVRCAENGGVMLWDEFDAAHPGVATYGNMLLANDMFGTPVGMKTKHKDFVLIAGLNTYGMGANRVYVGRNQLDGATLDRFVVIDWDYDEGLEAHMIGVSHASPVLSLDSGGTVSAADWIEYVRKVRAACDRLSIRHIVSPRATLHGAKLLGAGVGVTHVANMVLWKGVEIATVNKIKGEM